MSELGPLSGFTVAITADRRAEEQAEFLRRRQASIWHVPVIRTHPLGPDDGLRDATDELIRRPPRYLVLTTGIGTRAWFEAARSLGLEEELLAALRGATVLARGPKAAGAAITAGLEVSWRAPRETLRDVIEHLEELGISGARVAVQLDGASDASAVRLLAGLGADVVGVPVYRWTRPDDEVAVIRLVEAIEQQRVDAVTFTAAAAVHNLAAIAAEAGRLEAMRDGFRTGVVAACVGPVCADAAAHVGIGPVVVPPRARLGSMIGTLTEVLAARCREVRLAGSHVVLRGALVVVDGRPVQLSDRERGLLAVLLERRGAVVSKGELLHRVWRCPETNPHAVEMAVNRLRRKLGPAGDAIATVNRRGYRIAVESAHEDGPTA